MKGANIPTANFWKVNSLEKPKKLSIHHQILVVKADGVQVKVFLFLIQKRNLLEQQNLQW